MKNKTISITLIALLTISSFGLLFTALLPPAAATSSFDLSTEAPFAIDATPEMLGEKEVAIREYAAEVGAAEATQVSPIGDPATVGDEFIVTVSDMGANIDYDETFVVVMDGTHGIILIEKAAYYDHVGDTYYFPNPNGNASSSDPWERIEDMITEAQLAYLLDQFDTVMWPKVTSVYGEPLARGDEGQKVWILIHNIRDEAYYDLEQTSYVAGYFSASEDAENNKNMMHIDSYDWIRRTGPGVARPYLYEGVFAHEFEHLVHFDIDPDEPSWVDEGLADLAGFLCGYGHSISHIYYYLFYHPIVSLTFWGGGLEDYGASYLFQLYLYEHYGGEAFVSALVQEQLNGIEGIEATLKKGGHRWAKFKNIFDDWTIANYLDDDRSRGGKYGYESLEMGSWEDTRGYTIEATLMNAVWGPPDQADFEVESGWWGLIYYGVTVQPQPYTAHYYRFNNDKLSKVYMDGDDFAGTLPYSGAYEWYSDAGAWAWNSFYQTFDIPAGGATLNFYTFYEIEGDWDYGYVEVYDHDADEWYTLDALGTVNYIAHPQDNPNTPAGREPMDYEAAGRWHAFTGASAGWIPIAMDLTPFAGHAIDLYFTSWQDGAYTEQMMYVDDISIPELGFFDDIEGGEGAWLSTGWYIFDGVFDNGWDVTVITVKDVPYLWDPLPEEIDAAKLLWKRGMWVRQGTQSGSMWIGATPVESGRTRVAIVSNHADHILTSSYVLSVKEKTFKWWK